MPVHRFKIAALAVLFLAQLGLAPTVSAAISGPDLLTGAPLRIEPAKKGTVVIFMSARCPCSDSHVEIVKKLAADFKDFSFVAVHSNADEPAAEAKKYFEAKHLPFPVIQDDGDKLADQMKAYKTPHSYLIAPDGRVLYKGGVTDSHDGPHADKHFLRDALNDVEAGKPVRISEGRTLGCIISRSGSNAW